MATEFKATVPVIFQVPESCPECNSTDLSLASYVRGSLIGGSLGTARIYLGCDCCSATLFDMDADEWLSAGRMVTT